LEKYEVAPDSFFKAIKHPTSELAGEAIWESYENAEKEIIKKFEPMLPDKTPLFAKPKKEEENMYLDADETERKKQLRNQLGKTANQRNYTDNFQKPPTDLEIEQEAQKEVDRKQAEE
jgi:hypothetical protein